MVNTTPLTVEDALLVTKDDDENVTMVENDL